MRGHVGVHGRLFHLRTEICMCDLRFSYHHALGSLIDPLGFLTTLSSVQELQLVSGVYRICVGGRA